MGWVTTWITYHFSCLYFIIPYAFALNKAKAFPFHRNVSLLLVIFLVIQSLKDHFYPGNRSIWRGFVLLSLPACHVKNRALDGLHRAAGTSSFRDGVGGSFVKEGLVWVFFFISNTWRNTPHVLLDMLQSVQSAPGKSLDISGVIHPSYLVHAFPFMSPADAFNCQPSLLGCPRSSRGTMESLWRRMKRRGPAVLWHFLALNWLWEEWPLSSR